MTLKQKNERNIVKENGAYIVFFFFWSILPFDYTLHKQFSS